MVFEYCMEIMEKAAQKLITSKADVKYTWNRICVKVRSNKILNPQYAQLTPMYSNVFSCDDRLVMIILYSRFLWCSGSWPKLEVHFTTSWCW